jgi:hypothetical protein
MKKSRVAPNLLAAAFLLSTPLPILAEEPDETAQIMDEGLSRSQVQQTAHELLDGIGQRLTNSTNMRKAEAWAVEKMRELGLKKVRKEGFEFGRGWDYISSDVRMVGPRALKLTAIPIAWTPPTDGAIEAEIFVAPIREKAHFEAYRGKLAGKIVLVSLPGTGDEPVRAPFRRLDSSEIAARDNIRLPTYDPDANDRRRERVTFALELDEFLQSEGAVAWVRMSYRDGKLVHGSGYTFENGKTPGLPGIEIAAEDYRRLARLAKIGPAPRLSINSQVRFVDGDSKAYNIIGEIPGTDPDAGYVMAGAHFDSWFAADGAVDNGAGSVTVLEAARILNAIGAKPKRSIRFVLWGGEEQGLHGSIAYVREHLVERDGEEGMSPTELAVEWRNLYPVKKKPGYSEMKAYFNMDNGSGKLRGIHAESNVGAESLLKSWLSPFADLGAGSVVAGTTYGTDHVPFQAVGLPGFQFVQDPLDYSARLHHTNIDTFDHLRPDDLRQAATVMAGVLLAAANDESELPREPLPQQPEVTDPFAYDYPEAD